MNTTLIKTTIKAAIFVVAAMAVLSGLPNYAQAAETFTISGIKFHDVNKNGTKEYSEAFMYNWTINISGDANGTTKTILGGTYEFTGLSPGSYVICEGTEPGWEQNYPGGDGCYHVDIVDEDITGLNFGNYMVPQTSQSTDTSNNTDAGTGAGTDTETNTGNSSENNENGDVLGDEAAPDIRLTKTGAKTFLNQGGQITYTVTATNTGEASAVNLVLTDTLPNGFTLAENGNSTVTWTIPELGVGETWSETFPVNVSGNATIGSHANIVRGTADNHGDLFASHAVEVRQGAVLGKTGASPWSIALAIAVTTILGIAAVEMANRKMRVKNI